MTAGKAIELCDQMRPNNDFGDEMKQMWLRQCDARLRQTVVDRSACGDFDAVGADMAGDGLEYDTQLLAPDAFSALYQHWLCAQMDLALGETARAVNELRCTVTTARSLQPGCGRNTPRRAGCSGGIER